MRMVIIGYGRVGSRAARAFSAQGHEVTVIDHDPVHLRRAVDLPGVKLINGDAIDLAVQRDAGVAEADRLLALAREDNVNLMAAQVARTFFDVPEVIARVWEPSHAGISDDPKLITVCPTLAAVEDVVRRVDPSALSHLGASDAASRDVRREELPADSHFVLIVGGGKVGLILAGNLHRAGQEVALVERDPGRARELELALECPVILGDGSVAHVLEAAGAARARVLVAVTGKDQDNLITCQLAKRRFGVTTTIARASNPQNEEVFQRLGVDTPVSTTAIIEQVIARELPTVKIKTLLQLQNGGTQLVEYVLDHAGPAVGPPLREIVFPADCNLVAVVRRGATIVPRGDTQLEVGDMVVALVGIGSGEALARLLVGSPA